MKYTTEQNIAYLKKYMPKESLEKSIKKLQEGIPLQYIIGNVNFYGYIFKVNEKVLIPRFETEELVEKTINYIKKNFKNNIDIIDLGTGSGCIGITLKKELENAQIDAIDISKEALKVAKENAKINNVKIKFIKNNFLENINKKYDIIISNPPYISKDEEVEEIVKNNEPNIALFADNDGIKCYEDILKNASKNLKEKSILAFEIGMTQGDKLINLSSKYFPFSKIIVEKDLQKRDRFLFIFNNCE